MAWKLSIFLISNSDHVQKCQSINVKTSSSRQPISPVLPVFVIILWIKFGKKIDLNIRDCAKGVLILSVDSSVSRECTYTPTHLEIIIFFAKIIHPANEEGRWNKFPSRRHNLRRVVYIDIVTGI